MNISLLNDIGLFFAGAAFCALTFSTIVIPHILYRAERRHINEVKAHVLLNMETTLMLLQKSAAEVLETYDWNEISKEIILMYKADVTTNIENMRIRLDLEETKSFCILRDSVMREVDAQLDLAQSLKARGE